MDSPDKTICKSVCVTSESVDVGVGLWEGIVDGKVVGNMDGVIDGAVVGLFVESSCWIICRVFGWRPCRIVSWMICWGSRRIIC